MERPCCLRNALKMGFEGDSKNANQRAASLVPDQQDSVMEWPVQSSALNPIQNLEADVILFLKQSQERQTLI